MASTSTRTATSGSLTRSPSTGFPSGDKRGHQVVKFSPDGKVLMTLGTPGEAGGGTDHFNSPSDVAVAPNGDIFVADGHNDNGNNRVVKFSKDGKFVKDVGQDRLGAGRVPHAPRHRALIRKGVCSSATAGNNRIQIFDQEGKSLASGRSSETERHLLR